MTAAGRQTTARLTTGDRILITDDPAGGPATNNPDPAGIWVPARRKTKVITATVERLEPATQGSGYQIVTDRGTVTNADGDGLPGHQTVALAPLQRAASEGKTLGEMTPDERREVTRVAVAQLNAELNHPAMRAALSDALDTAPVSAVEPVAPAGETFEQQGSEDGGRTWQTVAVGLGAADVTGTRERDAAGEGRRWRFLPETDNGLARLIAAKEAQLVATRNEFAANADRPLWGKQRTKQFGRRVDSQLRRAGQLGREVERLEGELRGLRRRASEPEPAPLDLDRLPYAKAIRTATGWYRVLKVNAKSVVVEVPPGWDNRFPLSRILEIREHTAEPSAPQHPVEGREAATAPPTPATPEHAATSSEAESFVSGWRDVNPAGC